MDKLKVVSWNCEDFYQYSSKNKLRSQMMYQLNKNNIIEELKSADIILLQEWNEETGTSFFHYLEYFEKMVVDRTAVLYRKSKFTDAEYLEIELLWEPPAVIERAYTSGRVKKNIFAKLLYGTFPIFISCFHLSAYIPYFHRGFHSRQLTTYLNNCLLSGLFTNKDSIQNNILNFGFIIGGDTNFNDGVLHTNLLSDLIAPSLVNELGLHDVCVGNCENTYTQDFLCTHEIDFGKILWRKKSQLKNKQSRLDFLAVNKMMKSTNAKIVKVCNLSDHSLISTEVMFDEKSGQSVKGGYKRKKTILTKRKRRRNKKRKTKRNV